MEALNSQELTVRVTDLKVGDVLTATNGVITHAPYDSFRCPKGKINVGVNGMLKIWGKSTTVTISRAL